jgi:hypothetical protein
VPLYRDCMRELLLTMFRGWELHALSWNGKEYDRTPEECMTEATGGDELLSATILLMAYWDNDLVGIAPHYGIAFVSPDYDHSFVPYIRTDIPPAPSEQHYWDNDQWNAPPEKDDETEASDA